MSGKGGGEKKGKERRRKDLPKTVADLRAELKEYTIPESAYTVFQRAVDYHLNKQYQEARWEYEKLHHIPRSSGGTFDLVEVSKTFQHNLRVLDMSEFAGKEKAK